MNVTVVSYPERSLLKALRVQLELYVLPPDSPANQNLGPAYPVYAVTDAAELETSTSPARTQATTRLARFMDTAPSSGRGRKRASGVLVRQELRQLAQMDMSRASCLEVRCPLERLRVDVHDRLQAAPSHRRSGRGENRCR